MLREAEARGCAFPSGSCKERRRGRTQMSRQKGPERISLHWPRQRRLRATLNFLSSQAVTDPAMSAMNSHILLENNWKADGIVFSPSSI